jgi:hypothetical protein
MLAGMGRLPNFRLLVVLVTKVPNVLGARPRDLRAPRC